MQSGALSIGRWRVEPRSGQLEAGGEKLRLKPKVMALLTHLARNPGQVISKEHLQEALWNGAFVTENTLMNAVSELRRALGDDAREPQFIETLPKRGYRLIAPVNRANEQRAAAPQPLAAPRRIVVLPFEELCDSTCEKHVAAMITVLVANALEQHPAIRVVSRASSTAVCREGTITLPEVCSRLQAERILEGSLLCAHDAFEIVVRLYDENDDSLWSDVFAERSTASLSLLKKLAQQIAERVVRVEGARA